MEEELKLKEVVDEFQNLIDENKLKQQAVIKNYSHDVDTMVSLLNALENKEQTLKINIEKPYFARIDFKDSNSLKTEVCYIGKIGTMNEDNKIVTVDWRTPIASLYYDSALGNTSYLATEGKIEGNLLLKRQYNIENRKLLDYYDVDTVSNDELLNSCLSTSVDSRLKNIVSTIQKEQNDIIRKPIEQDIIVQGVAGSGKTTVALHRIAYLVYQNRDHINIDQYMIIGPNKFFVNYISSVLPDLDVNGVGEFDLLEFTNTFLGENIKLDKTADDYITKFKMSISYKGSLDKYVTKLNELVVPNQDLEMFGFTIMKREEILKIYESVCKDTETILNRVERTIMFIKKEINLRQEKLIVLANKYIDSLFEIETNNDVLKKLVKQREMIKKEIKDDCSSIIKKYFNVVNEKTSSLYINFLKSFSDYEENVTLTLKNPKIKYEDLVALLYLRYRIVGNGDYLKYQHVVIDESQDYGDFFFYTLKCILSNASFSVFGDLAQTIYEYRTIESWNKVIDVDYDSNLHYLSKSYRTTIEIMEAANKINKYLGLTEAEAVIRHGKEVVYEKLSYSLSDKINEFLTKGYKTIAVISKTKEDAYLIYQQLKDTLNINLISDESLEYNGGVCSITSNLSKGLEFDAVIINKANSNVFNIENDFDMKLLYVSMTRALHELVVTYDDELVSVLK